jgi:hypothetical protein
LIGLVQIAFPPEGVNFTHRSVLLLHGAAFSSQTWVDKVGQLYFVYFFGGLSVFSYSFAYVALFVFLRDVWIRTQRAAVASRRATN